MEKVFEPSVREIGQGWCPQFPCPFCLLEIPHTVEPSDMQIARKRFLRDQELCCCSIAERGFWLAAMRWVEEYQEAAVSNLSIPLRREEAVSIGVNLVSSVAHGSTSRTGTTSVDAAKASLKVPGASSSSGKQPQPSRPSGMSPKMESPIWAAMEEESSADDASTGTTSKKALPFGPPGKMTSLVVPKNPSPAKKPKLAARVTQVPAAKSVASLLKATPAGGKSAKSNIAPAKVSAAIARAPMPKTGGSQPIVIASQASQSRPSESTGDFLWVLNTRKKQKRGWSLFSTKSQMTLEDAYIRGQESVQLGRFTVHFRRMVQESDWGMERDVKRIPIAECEGYDILPDP